MHHKLTNSIVPSAETPRTLDLEVAPRRSLRHRISSGFAVIGAGIATAGSLVSHVALAAGTGSTTGIGQQLQNTAQEGATASGTMATAGMYAAAFCCTFFGAWALWTSRNPANRETGKIGMGVAGLLLAGLFATGPTWIGKASQSISGSTADITSTASAVNFGG